MEKNKKITTNELAGIINAGFEATDKRTDAKSSFACRAELDAVLNRVQILENQMKIVLKKS